MPRVGLLPIQLEDLDEYFRKRDRWIDAINRFTARSSCELSFSKAIAAFYSPFAEVGDLLSKGLESGFKSILDRQVDVVCVYLGVSREELKNEYLL